MLSLRRGNKDSTMGIVILLTLGMMALAVAMIAVRPLLIKGGEFRGTCSTHNPLLADKGVDCSTCPNRYKADCPAKQSLKTDPSQDCD